MAETQSAPSLRELSEAATEQTQRGFAIIRFADRYGEACSLQKSSLATEDCVWFGIDSANPQIMASQARAHGLDPQSGSGWVPYPIPREVSLSTRMHLSREDVAVLLPILAHFAETGELSHAAPPTTLTEAVAAARAEGRAAGLEEAARISETYVIAPGTESFVVNGHKLKGSYDDHEFIGLSVARKGWRGMTAAIRDLIPAPPTTPGGRTDG